MEFVEFEVNALEVEGSILPKDLREELLANATYIRSLNVWLFEGDWETTLSPWEGKIRCLRKIVMPAYGGWSEQKLTNFIRKKLA